METHCSVLPENSQVISLLISLCSGQLWRLASRILSSQLPAPPTPSLFFFPHTEPVGQRRARLILLAKWMHGRPYTRNASARDVGCCGETPHATWLNCGLHGDCLSTGVNWPLHPLVFILYSEKETP